MNYFQRTRNHSNIGLRLKNLQFFHVRNLNYSFLAKHSVLHLNSIESNSSQAMQCLQTTANSFEVCIHIVKLVRHPLPTNASATEKG